MTNFPHGYSLEATIKPSKPVWEINIGKETYRFHEVERLDFVVKLREIRKDNLPERTMIVIDNDSGSFPNSFKFFAGDKKQKIVVIGGSPDLLEVLLTETGAEPAQSAI
jgi:hypothetical protein